MTLGAPALASECRFARAEDLHVVVAARLWELIDAAVEERGRATIALAGGSTPVPIYNLLREMPLPWDRLTLVPTDERWVNVDDPDSNEGMFRRELLAGATAGVELLSMARSRAAAAADAAACDESLARLPAFDAVLLGMGADGHTASWFPGARGLQAALEGPRRCVAVEPATTAQTRITLTRDAVVAAQRLLLVIGGPTKWEVYERARDAPDPTGLPVSAVLHQDRAPVDVYWSAD